MRTHLNFDATLREFGINTVKSQAKNKYPMGQLVYSQDDKKICMHDGVTPGGVWCFATTAADFKIMVDPTSGLTVTANGSTFTLDLDLCAISGLPKPITSAFKLLACDALGNLISVPPYVAAVPNNVPNAVDDLYSTPKNVQISGNVGTNDTDVDGNPLSFALVAPPANTSGVLVFNQNGTFTFTPANNFVGQAQFTYQVSDGAGGSDIATVTINVTALANNAPVAVNDAYNTLYQTAVAGTLKTNDTDADGDAISGYVVVTQPAHGSIALATSGAFSYTPASGWSGTDTFTYKCYDVTGAVSNIATVTIVTAAMINNAPIAYPDTVTTAFNTAISIPVTANDTDDIGIVSVTIVGAASNGSAVLNGNNILYTPATGFTGVATVQYFVTDAGGLTSNTTTVTINVGAAAATVDAINDTIYARPYYKILNNPLGNTPWFGGLNATPVTFDPRTNDISSNGTKTITNAVVSAGAGSVAFTGSSITFTPALVLTQRRAVDGTSSANLYDMNNAAGEQNSTITYTLMNGAGASDTATINVILGSANYDSFFEVYYGTDMNDGSILV